MYIKNGKKIYIKYEIEHNLTVDDDFINVLKSNGKLPFFFNSIHFIQKCYNSYGDDDITNKHISDIYKMASNTKKYYHTVDIPKRSGGNRTLTIPNRDLKYVQKYILNNIFSWFKAPSCVTAYTKNRGIKSNAVPHVKSKYILKLDIHDFFGSIHFGKVVNNILPKEIYPLELRTLLANLCIVNNSLPQGASTSPMLSNIIMEKFDRIISAYCKENNLVYTRYADDMTFSSIDKFDYLKLINKVKYLLSKYYNMELNEDKTIFLHDGLRQEICGVIVNEYAQVRKEYRDSIRQEMYYLNKYGVERHIYALYYDKKIDKVLSNKEYYIKLLGKIRYVLAINPSDEVFKKYQKEILSYIEKENIVDYPEEIKNYYSHKRDLYLDYESLFDEHQLLYCLQNNKEFDEYDFPKLRISYFINEFYTYGHDMFKENFEESMLKALKYIGASNLEKRDFDCYVLFIYYYYFQNQQMDKEALDLAEKLTREGNYRALTLYAINLENKDERLILLKDCADGKDGLAQYHYAIAIKDSNYKEYVKYILASADNGITKAYSHAVNIYMDSNMKEQVFYYLSLGVLDYNEECLKIAKEYKEKMIYKPSKKIAGIINRYNKI